MSPDSPAARRRAKLLQVFGAEDADSVVLALRERRVAYLADVLRRKVVDWRASRSRPTPAVARVAPWVGRGG